MEKRLTSTISKDAQVFESPLIRAVGSVGAFYGIIGMYLVFLGYVTFDALHAGQLVQRNERPFGLFLVGGFFLVLALFPGKGMVGTPYTVTLERGRGIWLCGPPKVWISLDEIASVGTYSSWFGPLPIIELSRSYGVVKRVHLFSLVSADKLANQLRSSLDRPSGAQSAKSTRPNLG